MSKLTVSIGGKDFSFLFLVSDARRLKTAGYDIFDAKKYETMFGDIVSQLDVLAEFCKPQAEKYQISDAQFLDDIVREPGVFQQAMEAFIGGIENFFQNLNRPAMLAVIKKSKEVAELSEVRKAAKLMDGKVQTAVLNHFERLEKEIDEKIEALASGKTSLLAPE